MTSLSDPDRPAVPCCVALKEWAGIVRALADGRQIVLLRKGGIAEDSGTFRPEHPAFWLYPTWTHEAEQGLREGFDAPPPPVPGVLPITCFAHVTRVDRVRDRATLKALAPFTGWTEETLDRRYRYREPGLWALTLRIFRRADAWPLAVRPEHAGCRSWVSLDEPPPVDRLEAVIPRASFRGKLDEIASLFSADLSDLARR